MRINPIINIRQLSRSVFRLTLLILMSLVLINSSCGSRRSKLDRRNLIPENKLVPILTDIYLTDGLLGMPRISIRYPMLDSISTYSNEVEKYGYTKETLDKSLKYYFIKNPRKLIKIYDKVLGILSEMESRIQKDILSSRGEPGSLWTGPVSLSFPDPTGIDSTVFDITLNRSGTYTLTANVTIFPDDQSLNPGLTAFTCHPDSIETGRRNFIEPVYYVKDGHEHRYIVIFSVPPKTTLRIRGNLYDFANNPDDWEKHLLIKNIAVTYALFAK
jgi:hypothetical protein